MSRTNATDAPLPPTDPTCASACFDFLLIELVPLAQRIADQLHAHNTTLREEYRTSQIFHKQTAGGATRERLVSVDGEEGAVAAGAAPSTNGSVAGGGGVDDDETKEAVFHRLDGMGYRVGQALVERFSTNRPRPTTPLDSIKFLCKDLWPLLFRKPIDNLKTNHRGIFVLSDARFYPLHRMSVDNKRGPRAVEEAVERAQPYLWFPCGIIRGVLAGLGMDVTVQGDMSELPAATFQIRTKGAKA